MSQAPTQARSAAFPVGAEPSWRPDPVNGRIERWWDGTHWTDHTREAPQPAPEARPMTRQEVKLARRSRQDGRPSRVIAIATQVTLAITAVASALSMVGLVTSYNSVSLGIATGVRDESLWAGAARTLGQGINLYAVLLAIGAVLTAAWFAVRTNDRRVNKVLVRRSATMSIVSTIIPVIQLWWPAQGMKDLWHASRPELARSGLKDRLPVPASVFVWWAGLLASTLAPAALLAMTVGQVNFRIPLPSVSQVDLNTVGAQQATLALVTLAMAISFAFALLSTLALITVIGQVERHLAMPDAPAGQEFKRLAGG